ncbi:substrate-binding domain-containing protein [Paenarthrobacter sp. DKR-5]|uniref:LacI family DNA-binding transcriptional regulator n=1 Tax=Paenarthrobacter sp. DKR-5 TaxID=2835535 RepID=UPI001BDD0088|nr:substrate-binding domain-containing protein [Paenarthrobacter sp. DKR-5]MBT1003358.1 substrate-binding domain-containing protein [Paenarthrobacter sp. DKR-5]
MTTVVRPPKPTLAAVARAAGVSAPTVSKVVNGRDDVAPGTRARVLAALEDAGYQSPVQRRNAAPATTVVDLVFDALDSAYTIEVLNGVLEFAAVSDVEVLVSVNRDQPASRLSPERRAQRMLEEGRSGMIVVTSAFSVPQLAAFRRRQIPVVVIDPLNPPAGDVVSVGATNWAGGKAATEHLLELGHRRIAYLGGPAAAECSQARQHGYMAALMARGIPVNPEYILPGSFRSEHGVRGLKALLELKERPTAIFAANDSIALGVLGEARRQGVRIPEELSLVGFDSTYQAEEAVPALTSVAQPLREMGRAALRSVLRELRGEVLDSHRVELATQLVVRESTAPPAAPAG